MVIKSFSLLIICLSFLVSCNNTKIKNSDQNLAGEQNSSEGLGLILLDPMETNKSKIGDSFTINITLRDSLKFDSVQLVINNQLMQSSTKVPFAYKWETGKAKVGTNLVKTIFFEQGKPIVSQRSIKLLSDLTPKIYGYKIEKVFPHDIFAYTQGLIYDNGIMFEATGLIGKSSLRQVKFETGDVVQSFVVPDEMFGEGITIYKDKIIQLTWQNQVGLVYDKATFQLLKRFSYPTEGWGITTLENHLVMSDGTNMLYFLDIENYSEVSRIEVFDNIGPVSNLNELEFIDGEIYANIYQTDKIARIDPKTGKVLSYIDLKNLLKPEDRKSDTDVLNGICWDEKSKRLFVTGKKWPKLFQIQLVP